MENRDIFQCPECCEPIASDMAELNCSLKHGPFLRDKKNIYNFLQSEDTYFQDHWENFGQSEVSKAKKNVAQRFLKPLLDFQPKICLDLGAGDGVHLEVLSESAPDVDIIGLDIAHSGLRLCAERAPRATLLVANCLKIPLHDNLMDAVYSYGVLGYLESPWKGLEEMARVTKKGGLLGVWMYPKGKGLPFTLFQLVRRIFKICPYFLQRTLADLLVPFLFLLPTTGNMSLKNSSWSACREILLVNLAPRKLYFPTEHEVIEKIKSLGFTVVFLDRCHPITVWAQKRK